MPVAVRRPYEGPRALNLSSGADAMSVESGERSAWEDLEALVPVLLRCLDALAFVARHLHPPDFARVLEAVGEPDKELAALRPRLGAWTGGLAPVGSALAGAADEALGAFSELRGANDLRDVFRALRHPPRALEHLYPLASVLAPVSRFFLDPDARRDAAAAERLAAAGARDLAGVFHLDNDPRSRGGFSIYVPEDYTPDRDWPLVVALHGGSGHGRAFLWSWLAAARGHGAILATPTSTGETWALAGEDIDTPHLGRVLDHIRGQWRVDPGRTLLTGMSDGGTFTYVSGLESGSPFSHLAPVAASFHPFLAQMADAERLRGLPIHLVHGALDWMFDVEIAREANRALTAAGARVTYLEIDDLSHTYPREANAAILRWMDVT